MTGQLLTFALVSLAVIVVPGPDLLLTLKNAARGGRPGAAWTVAGVMVGNAVLAIAAVAGLTSLLAASQTVFDAVRIAGGIYLVYLGLEALRSYRRSRRDSRSTAEPARTPEVRDGVASTGRAGLRQGVLCNLTNPKVAAVYLSLFPQFDLAPLAPVTQHALLAAVFWTMALAWYAVVLALLARLETMVRSPVVARRIEAVSGGALTGLGAYVLGKPT